MWVAVGSDDDPSRAQRSHTSGSSAKVPSYFLSEIIIPPTSGDHDGGILTRDLKMLNTKTP